MPKKNRVLNIKELVRVSFQALKNEKSDTRLLNIEKPSRKKITIWNRIANLFFNDYLYKDMINIHSWWVRNTNNFRNKLEEKFSNHSTSDEEMEIDDTCEKVYVTFTKEDLKLLKRCISIYDSHVQFNANFADLLSEKLQENELNCWLRCKFNRFKKKDSQKKKSFFWTGTYECINKDCRCLFKCLIANDHDLSQNFLSDEFTNDLIVKVSFDRKKKHDKIQKIRRCAGEERETQSQKVLGNGVLNTVNDNIIFNSENASIVDQKVTNRFTLGVMQSALRHFYKISNESFIDALAAKNFTDQIFNESNSHLLGYVQDISISPFGFLLLCQIQLNVWSVIRKSHSVWYFDATGSIHKRIANQKKPFYYSIVMHDVQKKIFFPFAEFVSTGQDQVTISKYVGLIKNNIETEFYPEIVVVDMSWALINSILITFNNCNALDYLKSCFDLIVHKNYASFDEKIKVKIYLCSTHQLKNVIKKAKRVDVDYDVRNLFIFMYTLVLNSKTLCEVENYLINIYNVFNNTKFDATVIYSLNLLRTLIKERNLSNTDVTGKRTEEEKARDMEFEKFVQETENVPVDKSIENNSPFKLLFDNLIKKFKQNGKNDGKNLNENKYYCPQLFDILEKQLYLLPLWTGILIKPDKIAYATKTRLTNNPVENWFGQLKNKMKLKNNSTSEIVSLLYKRLGSSYIKNYSPNFKFDSAIFNKKPTEKWSKHKNKGKKKNIYFENFDFSNLHYELFTFDSLHFTNAFDFGKEIEAFKENRDKTDNQKQDLNIDYFDILNDFDKKDFDFGMKKRDNQTDQLIEYTYDFQGIDLEDFKTFIKSKFENFIEKNFDKIQLLRQLFSMNSNNFNKIIKFLQESIFHFDYDKQKVYSHYKKRLALEKNLFPICTEGDGNCLYNSISKLIFLNESDFFLIKSCALFTILSHETLFTSIIQKNQYEYNFDEFFSRMCRRREWASELLIFSICIFLKRTILVYTPPTSKEKTNRTKYSFNTSKNEIIRLGLVNNHFFPILRQGELKEKEFVEHDFINSDFINQISYDIL